MSNSDLSVKRIDRLLLEEPKSKKFRLHAQRLLLTYKTHLDKEEFIAWISCKVDIEFIRLAHESGEGLTPYEHTHVVLFLKDRWQSNNERILDFNNIHPHIRVLRNKKAGEDAKIYIAKEDPENEDLKDNRIESIVGGIQSCKTLNEAYEKYIDKVTDAMGIKTLYEAKERPSIEFDYEPSHEWQLDLMSIIGGKPDPRKIIWIIDNKGNTGKTALAKYLTIHEPERWFLMKHPGTSRDCSTTIAGAIDKGWEAHGVVIDLPRQAEHHISLYQIIEEIKDGCITTQKYEGRSIVFNTPWVVVMANWKPNKNMLSLDRWIIKEIKEGGKWEDWQPKEITIPPYNKERKFSSMKYLA